MACVAKTSSSRVGRRLVVLFSAALAPLAAVAIVSAGELPSEMEKDPYFEPLRTVATLPAGTLELWIGALQRGDDDVREACAALIRAQRLGIDVRSLAVKPLSAILSREDGDLITLRAAAAATAALDLADLAPQLASVLERKDRETSGIVEPALARWRYAPMAEVWRRRLEGRGDRLGHASRVMAIRGLASLGDELAAPGLREIALSPRRSLAERMAAAEGVAAIDSSHATAAAEKLAGGAIDDRRVAAAILTQGTGDQAIDLLARLASDDDPFVAAKTIERLLQIAPTHALSAAHKRRQDADPRLRLLALKTFAANPSEAAARAAASLLGDVHPDVRTTATDLLVAWGDVGARDGMALRSSVEQLVLEALGPDFDSVAVRQAVVVAARMRLTGSKGKLVQLLQHADVTVAIASAWGLSQFADPTTGPDILGEILRETERTVKIVAELVPLYRATPEPHVEIPELAATYEKVEHLIVALGRMRYAPAADHLADYVAKPTPQVRGEPPSLETFKQDRPRAAAIWSLGHIYADKSGEPPARLVAELASRMSDTTPIPAEAHLVRQMAAVSLGRMGRRDLLEQLRTFFDPSAAHTDVGRACGWAIGRLTGVEPQRETTRENRKIDWFLIPAEVRPSDQESLTWGSTGSRLNSQ